MYVGVSAQDSACCTLRLALALDSAGLGWAGGSGWAQVGACHVSVGRGYAVLSRV